MRAHSILPLLLAACAPMAAEDPVPAGPRPPSTANRLEASAHDAHILLRYGEGPDHEGALPPDGVLAFPPTPTLMPFNEVVPSWNVELPEGAGFRAELRVWDFEGGAPSAWYDLGTWGVPPERPKGPVRDELGVVDVDVFRSERTFDAVELRFVLRAAPDGGCPRLDSAWLCVSNTTGDPDVVARFCARPEEVDPALWQRRLDVPFRSQRGEDPAIAARICSPTSVAMVLAWYGIERPTAQVAARAYDAEHDIYGGWARAVQAAFVEGAPGLVMRFASLEELYPHIAEGRPVIVSIRASEGELRGAPYPSTGGHLIVVTGFDAEGNVHVNDPAAADPAQGVVTYAREDMERVWLARGGVAYVLLPPGS